MVDVNSIYMPIGVAVGAAGVIIVIAERYVTKKEFHEYKNHLEEMLDSFNLIRDERLKTITAEMPEKVADKIIHRLKEMGFIRA